MDIEQPRRLPPRCYRRKIMLPGDSVRIENWQRGILQSGSQRRLARTIAPGNDNKARPHSPRLSTTIGRKRAFSMPSASGSDFQLFSRFADQEMIIIQALHMAHSCPQLQGTPARTRNILPHSLQIKQIIFHLGHNRRMIFHSRHLPFPPLQTHPATGHAPAQSPRKLRSFLEREGCLSLRRALASIWRMRSRVTLNCWPTSSSV